MLNTEQAQRRWAKVLDHKDAPAFKDNYRRAVTAALLENQDRAIKEERSQMLTETTGTSAIQNFDPILISLVRRAMPNLIAYDVAGVQPMSGPTGLIFALKPKYDSTVAANKITQGDSALSGGKTGSAASPTARASYVFLPVTTNQGGASVTLTMTSTTGIVAGAIVSGPKIVPGTKVSAVTANTSVTLDTASSAAVLTTDGNLTFANMDPISSAFTGPSTTANGEALSGSYDDSTNTTGFKNMGFSIEKTTVTANTRALKADYTMELAQDLKAVHGLDAESELANILSSEILFEVNRELIETINAKAVLGAQLGYTTAGTFDVKNDADGRWAVERYKALLVAIELECNQIAKDTRRGKGNIVICSSNVASTLAAAGVLDYAPALSTNLEVDDTGNSFAGVLNGRIKVYVDPYSTNDYVTSGYRGTNPYDAGLFYAPYVPLTMVRAVDPNTFQPKIAFKTRYGLVANPFVAQINPGSATSQTGANRSNFYYRTMAIANLGLKGSTLTQAVS